jgi:hypothetical protein
VETTHPGASARPIDQKSERRDAGATGRNRARKILAHQSDSLFPTRDQSANQPPDQASEGDFFASYCAAAENIFHN